MLTYTIAAIAIAVTVIVFLLIREKRIAVVLAILIAGILAPAFQRLDGDVARADTRLSAEEWRVLAAVPLPHDEFLLAVVYSNGDLRTYRLHIGGDGEKDEFLKVGQKLRTGRMMVGRASRSRAGLADDDGMGFSFSEAAESNPKQH